MRDAVVVPNMGKPEQMIKDPTPELWDILDADGVSTGRVFDRAFGLLLPGEYHLVVHVWIRSSSGEYLIQKRARHLEWAHGLWATHGGSAFAGEDPRTAAVREVNEEIGLALDASTLIELRRQVHGSGFEVIWLADRDVILDELELSPEVDAVEWAGARQILNRANGDCFYLYDYLHLLPRGRDPRRDRYDNVTSHNIWFPLRALRALGRVIQSDLP
jgi:8-oxo-dGTP diphosphatase